MLGAHARAAEYKAAMRAQARQASREAEEQKLPPPAAPVSLGAFTRDARPSRNKGNKAYVPLVLEETPEATEATDTEDALLDTPTKKPTPRSDKSASSSSSKPPRVSMPPSTNPPTAPRAMHPSRHAETTPPCAVRAQSLPPYVQRVQLPPPQFMLPAAFAFQQTPVFAQPTFGWNGQIPLLDHTQLSFESPAHWSHASQAYHYPLPPVAQSAPPRAPTPPSPLIATQPAVRPKTPEPVQKRLILGPDDLSPVKQEARMNYRNNFLPQQNATVIHNSVRQQSDFRRPLLNPIRMRDPADNMTSSPSSQGNQTPQQGVSTGRPGLSQRYRSDNSSIAIAQSITLPNPLRQHTDPDAAIEPPVTAIPWNRAPTMRDLTLSNEEDLGQSDRAAKLQKFVAEQQVLSKQGKTVLNNPERKSTASTAPSTTVCTSEGPGPSVTDDEAKFLPPVVRREVLRPPPGLQKPARPFKPSPSTAEFEKPHISAADSELRHSFGVGDDDWFDLKPVSLADRKKMQSAMKRVTDKDSRTYRRDFHLSHRWSFHQDPAVYLEQNPRRSKVVREQIDVLARDYSARLHAAVGGQEPGQGEVDLHAGMVRSAGHTMVNLQEARQENVKPDYFNHNKQVPGHAIDHNVILEDPGSKSLFENSKDDTIARSVRDTRLGRAASGNARATNDGFGLFKQKYGWVE